MFLSLESNYIFFITLIFFVSLFIVNFLHFETGKKYNFSYYIFFILVANLSMLSFYSPIYYDLLGDFASDLNVYAIKITLLFFQLLFFTFIFISYKSYLKPEIFYFFNLSVASALFMISTSDYIITFILLELSSMPVYALIALPKNRFTIEAAVKYLIFGSLASQLFILSYVFYSNTLFSNNASDIFLYSVFSHTGSYEQLFTLFFYMSIFIKFGVGPFYNWLIDVYQASSYPLFVYNSTLSKLITFAPLYTLGQYFSTQSYYKPIFILILIYSSFHAVINMFFQNNIRRFFGYSSVINFSFLITVVFFNNAGVLVFFKYMAFYMLLLFLTYALFDIYRLSNSKKLEPVFLEDLGKTSNKNQQFYFALSIVFSSGLPPIGLFYVKAHTYGIVLLGGSSVNYILVAILILNSILSLFAYFRAIARSYNFSNSKQLFHITVENEESNSLAVFSAVLILAASYISFNWTYFMSL